MKLLFPLLMPWIALFLIVSGCSRDEQPPVPNKGIKVVKRIVKPPPSPPEKESAAPREEEKTIQSTPEPVETGALEEKILQMPNFDPQPQPATPREDRGHYVSRTGDTLMGIAAKEEVYGNPLKWPILCRYAVDDLGILDMKGDFHRKILQKGLRFKILQPEEVHENLRMRADHRWVVSVLSSTIEEEIIPPIVTLLKEGYPAYLTEARIKGNDWMRVRVGFFGTRTEAEAEGKKIMSLLKLHELWVTKIGSPEFKEYAGY